nr:WYL domain-containing protein [Corynebacterium lactis]
MAAKRQSQAGGDVTIDEFLAVVPYFSRSRSIMEASTELGIPANRLLEIFDQLALLDQPGDYGRPALRIKEPDRFSKQVQPTAELLARPLTLSALEATTLLLVLESIEASSSREESEAAQSAADKLRAVVRGTGAVVDTVSDMDLRGFGFEGEIRRALRDSRALQVTYRNASGSLSERTLDVLATMRVEQQTYLRAVDRSDEERIVKSFRADRIVAASVTDLPAGYYPEVTVDPRDPHAFGADEDADHWARVNISADATWIADYEPVYFVDEDESELSALDGYVEADIPMSNLDATIAFVLRRSPSVIVTDPVELRNAVVERASVALSEYGLDNEP